MHVSRVTRLIRTEVGKNACRIDSTANIDRREDDESAAIQYLRDQNAVWQIDPKIRWIFPCRDSGENCIFAIRAEGGGETDYFDFRGTSIIWGSKSEKQIFRSFLLKITFW